MTNEKKIELLEDMLELDPGTLTPETVLSSLDEWDSIAMISFIALVDDEFDKIIKGAEIRAQQTVADLMKLMEA